MKVIASFNGLEATRRAYELLTSGTDALDACVEGVTLVEDDPDERTVGYGGLPNEEGIVELDAAVMHGPTHRVGAVAAVRDIRHATRLAKLVMEQTDHVLLAGEGAKQFAQANGFAPENLLSEKARQIWLLWKRSRLERTSWLPPSPSEIGNEVARYIGRPAGTIHCAALDAQNNISCVTSTSGLAFKLPGRVGDSPIVGAGLYVDNSVGSCGSTGRGEAALISLASFAAVELMRSGDSPTDAGLKVLKRIAAQTPARLKDSAGKPNFNLQLFLLRKDGEHGAVSLRGSKQFALTDAHGSRLEECVPLYETPPD